jgi:molecular chaperone DnaJ
MPRSAEVPTDYYQTLGVAKNASEADIKRAYRGLARKFHPDVADDKAAAEERFKEINEAYEVLSDPQKRRQYDTYGSVGPTAGGGPGFGGFGSTEGFGDIFDMFFGGGRGGGSRPAQSGPQRGADLRYDLEITLEEAFAGADREIAFAHLTTCDTCRGNGAKPGTQPQRCDRCNGSGVARAVRQTPLGQFVTQSTCTKCGGEGQVVATPCETCRGRGRVERSRTLTVRIPAGVDDGSRIRVTGSGEAGAHGGPPGDLYVYLNVVRHERFRRDGHDLYIDVPIAFTQASLGGNVELESLDGPVEVHVPAGTQSNSMFRVRGRGMPVVRGSGRGDLYVSVHVMVPTKLSRREREVLEEFAQLGGDRIEERSFMERFKEKFAP